MKVPSRNDSFALDPTNKTNFTVNMQAPAAFYGYLGKEMEGSIIIRPVPYDPGNELKLRAWHAASHKAFKWISNVATSMKSVIRSESSEAREQYQGLMGHTLRHRYIVTLV